MKLLAVSFLVGLALVSAVPVPSHDLTLEYADDLDLLINFELDAEDDDGVKTELGKKLREELDTILEKLKENIEKGKLVREDLMEKLKEIRGKMKDMKVELGKKAKELIEQLKEKAKDYWKKILDKWTGNDKEAIAMSDGFGGMREKIKELIRKIKDALKNGDVSKLQGFSEKLKEILGKLKTDSKLKQILKDLREKVEQKLKEIMDKLNPGKRSFNFKEMLRKLKEKIKDVIDPDKLKEKIHEIFGKGSDIAQQLREKLKEKGTNVKQKILDFIDRFLEDEQEEKRSIKEVYQKIKEYLKNLKIDLKEKFVKFGEWAKEKYEKGLQEGKDRAETLRKLAREFIDDAKKVGKDVVEQAKEFFREYKDDLGTVYDDVREKVREILNRD